jgi:hypothetical protein
VVAAVIADTLGKPMAQIGTYQPRAPYKPVTVGAVADLDAGDSEYLGRSHHPSDKGAVSSDRAPI